MSFLLEPLTPRVVVFAITDERLPARIDGSDHVCEHLVGLLEAFPASCWLGSSVRMRSNETWP